MKQVIATLGVLLAIGVGAPTFAHATSHQKSATMSKAGDAYVDGEVRKVDKDAGKITIKHGPLAILDMPAMTMVFRAKDPAMLDKVKAGDSIRFKAEKLGGVFTVTEYQPVK